ncbi:MAG TPA: PASTA domain-containing protein [Nocardioides sp.]|nr:PASTA domain-containing protein [Nocardioides sp.]
MPSRAARRRRLACAVAGVLAVTTLSWVEPATAGGGTGCLVPELRGLRLRVAKTELEWANCSLGTVRTKRVAAWKRGYVIKQAVPPDSVRRAGFAVRVVVGR